MDEIKQRDLRLFLAELVAPVRLIPVLVVFLILFTSFRHNLPIVFSAVAMTLAVTLTTAYYESVKKRFKNRRFGALWEGCVDRLVRFEEVLRKMQKDQVADLHEMPATIRRVADSLYTALRRADLVSSEVQEAEGSLAKRPPAWIDHTRDPQSRELYQIADRNIAEYRAEYAGVMASVQRTEAQSAVFMTTVDTVRMKMLGYRLAGKKPELNTEDFLTALAEAKTQLEAIDTALDELEMGHYPKTIAAVPPPAPGRSNGLRLPPPLPKEDDAEDALQRLGGREGHPDPGGAEPEPEREGR
jgi:hypothetical protein